MFKITITEITQQPVIKEVYFTASELKEMGKIGQLDEDGKPTGKYITREKMESVFREVYSQQIENINLKNVIAAFNP